MSTVTENDLKRLEDLIIASREENRQRFTTLETGLVAIQKEVNEIKVSIGKLDEKVIAFNQRIDDSNNQIKEVQARINGQTNWFIGIFSVLVAGLLGILSKIAFFPNPQIVLVEHPYHLFLPSPIQYQPQNA